MRITVKLSPPVADQYAIEESPQATPSQLQLRKGLGIAPGIRSLVTKRGDGTLADADRPLPLKEAKPLPSSD